MKRKDFLTALGGTAAVLLSGRQGYAKTHENIQSDPLHMMNDQTFHTYFPSQDPQLAQEMVLVAHGQTEKVKALLAAHPELAKASWDWGYGDWETAIGAASHTGSKEIAQLLMDQGARPDIFTFTMMGNLPAVRAMVEGNPGVEAIPGPHGISLLAHARIRLMSKTISEADKIKGQEMVDYLSSLAKADNKAINLEVSETDHRQYVGQYRFGEQTGDVFGVDLDNNGALSIKRQGQKFERQLFRVGENTFAPIGAPHVRIIFEIKDEAATSLTIHDPAPVVKATRMN